MKRTSLLLISILFATILLGQKGWRQEEMEIKLKLTSRTQADLLQSHRFQSESASLDGSEVYIYVTPLELTQLRQEGFDCTVTIPNLNEHYDHFWDEQALVPSGYYTYEEIVAIADSLALNFPSICKKVSYGTSIGGRQLAALKISDHVELDENEPELMFDGGIHGDEVGGPQNLIMLARDLCKGYGSNTTYTDLINSREIWLYYMVNPDGRVNMTRLNDNGVDCNRDAGYMWDNSGNSWDAFSQPETRGVRDCILDNQFVVYINYHSGVEMICYPWSYRAAATPDNPHLNQLANIYSTTSGYPYLQYGQGYQILYQINGCFKDFDYGSVSGVGWTVEISTDKQPPSYQIPIYYQRNLPSMVEMINRAGYGLEGVVTDSITGEPIPAIIWINNFYPTYNDPIIGDFHKYVLPNSYTVRVSANGYQSKTMYNVNVPSTGSATVNFQLVPKNNHHAFKVLSCRVPNNNEADPGYTPGILGEPDGISYALGKSGWIILDMGDTVYNIPNKDLKIIESTGQNRKYTCFASLTKDGPWLSLGVGTGTTEFDLATSGLTKARYFKLLDDGDGGSSGAGIGFNLDAVEMICNLDVELGNDTIIQPGATILLDAGNPGCSYLWSTGETTQTILVDSTGVGNGTAHLTVEVSRSATCTSSDSINVTFDPHAGFPTGRYPQEFMVFPNPTEGLTNLVFKELKGGKLMIYSPLGQLISVETIDNSHLTTSFDFSNLPHGLYTAKVIMENGFIVKKIMVY